MASQERPIKPVYGEHYIHDQNGNVQMTHAGVNALINGKILSPKKKSYNLVGFIGLVVVAALYTPAFWCIFSTSDKYGSIDSAPVLIQFLCLALMLMPIPILLYLKRHRLD